MASPSHKPQASLCPLAFKNQQETYREGPENLEIPSDLPRPHLLHCSDGYPEDDLYDKLNERVTAVLDRGVFCMRFGCLEPTADRA